MTYKIIGHRGDRAKYPENTLSGFKSALETNDIDGFELDIVVTKDKKLVISHDLFLKDSTNKKRYIHTYTYTELLALSKTLDGKLSQETMKYPTLEDVLSLCNSRPKKTILIEIKSLPIFDFLPLSFPELIKEIHILLNKYNILYSCYIISFDYRIIKESYNQNPNIKIGLILHRNFLPLSCIINTVKPSLLIMEKEWITKDQVKEMIQENIDIFAWTPNSPQEWLHLTSIGIKGIITDKPKDLSIFRKRRESVF